ncbi:MAG: carbamoyltransferase [Gammaproteobacteria bacterium]|nr:carbamoyltransferase [Gammaproteobacteria bacterium]
MNVLGLSAYYHDSAAALLQDGRIVAAAQEERFTRRKHDAAFPAHAMSYCLEQAGLGCGDLDAVAFYERPLAKFERLLETYLAYAPRGFASFRKSFPVWASRKLRIPDEILRRLGGGFRGELCLTDHHESHAASAFFPSPFRDAAVLTLDAVGEWSTSSLAVGTGNRLRTLEEIRFPHSLGMLYSAFTEYTGFKVNSGEYKLMGLAPYGTPRYVDLILDEIVDIAEDGSLRLDMSCFDYCGGLTMTSPKLHELFGGPPRRPESTITQKDMDIAASIQRVCEEAVLRAARHAHRETGMRNLAMAGGVALNCVANGRLLRDGPFERIWVQPAAGDAGGALGAALLVWHHKLDAPRTPEPSDSQQGSLLGPEYEAAEIARFLDSVGADYSHVPEEAALLDSVADLLAQQRIVGWFQGRMEYGPRALGCRSIIGDPRSPGMQQTMNLKIKFRESFRPFAPCVLRELASEVFEMRPEQDSPYMLFVAPVRSAWLVPPDDEDRARLDDPDLTVRLSARRSKLPAITHVDGSARVQTVDADRHGRFYRLLRSFYEKTACPVIVNTSFNVRGEPIVCTPGDAFRCFMATEMDCLVLGDFLLIKERQPANRFGDARTYRTRYELD